MSGSDLGGPTATPGRSRTPAWAEKRVALGDLTNVLADGRFGAADADRGVDKARKLKPSFADIEILKRRLLEEQQRRERAEVELSKLKGTKAGAEKLELQLASCSVLPSDKLDGSRVSVPQQLADFEKLASTNLNETTLVEERVESATEEVSRLEHIVSLRCLCNMLPEQDPRDGDGTSLKDVASRMDEKFRELESTIDTLNEIITQQHSKLNMMNERLSIKEREVSSLERERDQLCSEVVALKSKVGISDELVYGDYSISSTEVPCMVNTPAVDSEAKPERKKTTEWLSLVKELKGKASYVKKQPVLIEIGDDEEASMWHDDNKKPLNPSSSGEPGAASFEQKGSCEWFFRGNKLMLSSGMKKHLKEICDCVPPEIPFYLYQMNKSNLKPNGNMRLSAKYTSTYLACCLKKREGCARLEVDGEDCGMVRINLLRDGRASLSPDWQVVVGAKNIKVGDICAFHFRVSNGGLNLAIHLFHVVRYLMSLK